MSSSGGGTSTTTTTGASGSQNGSGSPIGTGMSSSVAGAVTAATATTTAAYSPVVGVPASSAKPGGRRRGGYSRDSEPQSDGYRGGDGGGGQIGTYQAGSQSGSKEHDPGNHYPATISNQQWQELKAAQSFL
jgi:hypothetical protein